MENTPYLLEAIHLLQRVDDRDSTTHSSLVGEGDLGNFDVDGHSSTRTTSVGNNRRLGREIADILVIGEKNQPPQIVAEPSKDQNSKRI